MSKMANSRGEQNLVQFAPDDLNDRQLKIAQRGFEFVETEIRPILARDGILCGKGSNGATSKLRRLLAPLDKEIEVTHATAAAMALDKRARKVEHVIPVQRICVEIIDPSKANPRYNPDLSPIADGPARSPAHLLALYKKLALKCWVTVDEHCRLNRCMPGSQWDAPGGDGWARYRAANVIAHPLGFFN